MAKKNFKLGLGNLIKDTQEKIQKQEDLEAAGKLNDIERLEEQIELMQRELYNWRNGILTLENFESSLEEYNLRYNPENNAIEKK